MNRPVVSSFANGFFPLPFTFDRFWVNGSGSRFCVSLTQTLLDTAEEMLGIRHLTY